MFPPYINEINKFIILMSRPEPGPDHDRNLKSAKDRKPPPSPSQ